MMLRRILLLGLLVLLPTGLWAQSDKAPLSSGQLEESLVKVLRTSNKAQTNQFVCETFEFKHINPFNVINFFWAATSREEGGIYSFAHPTEERGFVVAICPEHQLDSLRRLAAHLDRPKLNSSPGSRYIYYRMQHRNSFDPGFRNVASYYLGSSGVLLPDVETNSMLIFDAPEGARQMEAAFMEVLDQPLRQVEVNVKVFEVFVNNDAALGLDFVAWKNGPGKMLGLFSADGAYLNTNIGSARGNQRTRGFYLNYPAAFFDFLVEKGKAESLIEVKATSVNGIPATISTGEKVLFYRNEMTSSGRELTGETAERRVAGANISGPDTPLAIIEPIDSGVSLTVVPTIGDSTINLAMDLKVVSISGYDGNGRPLLNSRRLTEEIAVQNGEEVVYGGLSREKTIQSTRKVPFFGSLPIIGYLFGGENTSTKQSIIVTVVTPELLQDGFNISESDRAIARKAAGEDVVVLPKTEFGFEQTALYTH